ncbi:MAG: efflux RND transporter periplasmic adaptor subunit [Gammaproteobacteria bacterium]|nr:efflux RND transporter periplasmic adaptor subunit [Gammaproteobacteria bacterium]MDE2024436.1 efflux RND transporter periplasmic adaptor subunit [Gammaproteobacteria bacterium]
MDKKDALNALKIDREAQPAPGRGGRGWWLGGIIAVLAVLLIVAAWWIFYPRTVMVQAQTVAVQGADANSGSILNASGYVVAEQQATVSSQITGMITVVYAQEGMRVKQGEVLARLDDRGMRAALAAAQSVLQADQALVAQNRAQLLKDRQNLTRTKALAKQHLMSRADLDNAQAAVDMDKAALAHAQGQVKVDQDNLQAAQIGLSYTVIRAPFNGVVTEKYAHPGEMISPAAVGGFTQTGICTLVDMQSLEIDVDVNEAYIQRVHNNMRVDAVLDAYPNWHIPAHVISVVPTANKEKATVKVRIAFDKLDARILPQMGVQVWFYPEPNTKAQAQTATISIPQSALHGSGASQYVYLVVNGNVKQQSVKTLPGTNGQVTVVSGLNGGETLVTAAPSTLHDGEAVRVASQ